MNRTSVVFKNPYEIELREESLPSVREGEVLIETRMSAISAGSEMLVYHGQFPQDLTVDEKITALAHEFRYPLKYGYTSVGRVVETGPGVSKDWLDQSVFCFHPHESHYVVRPDQLIPIPKDTQAMDALFLPNMETAVNFLMDARPVIGECVIVFGQGIVGLLTTSLLAQYPLGALITLDNFALRREKSLAAGAQRTLDPHAADLRPELMAGCGGDGADLVFELSGNPSALQQAIAVCGFASRIVLGSWYGTRKAELDLGAKFHRSRIRIISSQVSTLAPEFSARWVKSRRLKVAWEMLRRVQPRHFISHRFHISRVKDAFALLDKRPQEALQVILTYTH